MIANLFIVALIGITLIGLLYALYRLNGWFRRPAYPDSDTTDGSKKSKHKEPRICSRGRKHLEEEERDVEEEQISAVKRSSAQPFAVEVQPQKATPLKSYHGARSRNKDLTFFNGASAYSQDEHPDDYDDDEALCHKV